MHNFVLNCVNFLRSFLHLMKIVFVFCILMLLCYWVQNLTGADWAWLGFIKPFLDGLLDFTNSDLSWLGFMKPFLDGLLEFANSIYSVTFDFFGAKFEFKYFSAVIILTAGVYLMNLFIILANIAEGAYKSAHYVAKKTQEAIFNQGLKASIEKEQKKITKY